MKARIAMPVSPLPTGAKGKTRACGTVFHGNFFALFSAYLYEIFRQMLFNQPLYPVPVILAVYAFAGLGTLYYPCKKHFHPVVHSSVSRCRSNDDTAFRPTVKRLPKLDSPGLSAYP